MLASAHRQDDSFQSVNDDICIFLPAFLGCSCHEYHAYRSDLQLPPFCIAKKVDITSFMHLCSSLQPPSSADTSPPPLLSFYSAHPLREATLLFPFVAVL